MYLFEQIWQSVLDIASWILDGNWYEIALSIAGIIALIFLPRGIVLGFEGFFEIEVPDFIKVLLTILMFGAFLLLVIGLVWTAAVK